MSTDIGDLAIGPAWGECGAAIGIDDERPASQRTTSADDRMPDYRTGLLRKGGKGSIFGNR